MDPSHCAGFRDVPRAAARFPPSFSIGQPHRLEIYPPIGHTADEGHDFPFLGVSIGEPDVFTFLDKYMR